jgi:hypothetical protein
MYYHYAILLLFRPFLKLDLVGSTVSPREICRQAAEAICALTNSYSKLYTLERTPSFVPYFILTAGITHLVSLGNGWATKEPLVQSIQHLKGMSGGHGVAGRAIGILRYLVLRWGIDIRFDEDDEPPQTKEAQEKMMEIEENKDSIRCVPSPTSNNLFNPDVEMLDSVSSFIRNSPEVDSFLFWTFPLQGRPFIPTDTEQLEQAGFKLVGGTTEPLV